MKNLSIDNWTIFPYFLLLFLYTLTSLQIAQSLSPFFRFALITVIGTLSIWIFKYRQVELKKVLFFFPAIIFELIYIFNNSNSYANSNSNFSIAYQAILFLIVYLISGISWKRNNMIIFCSFSFFLYILLILINFTHVAGVDSNSIGAYTYYLAFFPLIYIVEYSKHFKRTKLFWLFITILFLIVVSHTRSVLLCTAFGLLTFALWKIITKSKFLFRLYFLLYLVGIYFFTVIYPQLNYYLTNFDYYNALVVQYTGKNLLSGRQRLWSVLLNVINYKPYFGYGSGALPNNFLNTELSSHNLYIQTTLQVGIVGLVFLLIFLFFIWNKFWINRFDKKVVISACYLLGIIVHQVFEVTLTQNNFAIGALQWTIIGLGLSYCFNKEKAAP
jgi:O-antigen ligase